MSDEIVVVAKRPTKRKVSTEHLAAYQFHNVPRHVAVELGRTGGRSKSPEKIAAVIQNLPYNKNLLPEQSYAIASIKANDYKELIRHLILTIASKAETSKEYNDLLTQVFKIPFVQKIINDMENEKQRDIIPIVVELLHEEGQDELIGKLYDKLTAEGWKDGKREQVLAPMPAVRPVPESDEWQGGGVEDSDIEDVALDALPDVQPQASVREGSA